MSREPIPQVDRVVHEPARMAILSVLDGVTDADFLFLGSLLGLSRGNLSSHLATLEAAGYVQVTKSFRGRRPHTAVHITDAGRQAREAHWAALESLRDAGRTHRETGQA